MELMDNMIVLKQIHLLLVNNEKLKEKMKNFVSLVSDCETPDTPSKELMNSNTPQPPSGPIRPNNIRRPLGRVSSEQSLNSIESTKDKLSLFR